MGLSSEKRDFVYDSNNKLVGTNPIHLGVDELKSLSQSGIKTLIHLLSKHDDLKKILKDNDILIGDTLEYTQPTFDDESDTDRPIIDTPSGSESSIEDTLYDSIDLYISDDENDI